MGMMEPMVMWLCVVFLLCVAEFCFHTCCRFRVWTGERQWRRYRWVDCCSYSEHFVIGFSYALTRRITVPSIHQTEFCGRSGLPCSVVCWDSYGILLLHFLFNHDIRFFSHSYGIHRNPKWLHALHWQIRWHPAHWKILTLLPSLCANYSGDIVRLKAVDVSFRRLKPDSLLSLSVFVWFISESHVPCDRWNVICSLWLRTVLFFCVVFSPHFWSLTHSLYQYVAHRECVESFNSCISCLFPP